MEAPKCWLCGVRHWGGCPEHKQAFDRDLPRPRTQKAYEKAHHKAVEFERAIERTVASTVKPVRLTPSLTEKIKLEREARFDRVAYQREYMRKRRAKAKR